MVERARVAAILGPTNTGKTHYAIERMLGHRTGMIGLPLRLLAREVYDKVVAVRGPGVVALVTGEERIVPPRAAYWICTVEAMPEGMGCDFVGIDEIQLCADPERGHVFTDRLLRMRGQHETLFMGSDTMRGPIAALVPGCEYMRRERMSQLSYTESKKISRLPARSAIVGFSVDNVYAIAELLRRQKGGAAVVMGALSPRTRNAQVELYQNGDVDFLVATDAIGMGLNLDIDHVAFSSLTKFDGRRMRDLQPNELAQIAGRAGRGMSNGTFGVTGEASPIPEDWVEAICNHQFTPLRKLKWRNADLSFGSIDRLVQSLEKPPTDERLIKARDADDLMALKSLSQVAEVAARASDPASVKLLWDVCRIPDFRGISHAEHAGLLEVIFSHLHQRGGVPDDFIAGQVKRIDRVDGDIDTLSKRLAFIRTWTYVAQRKGWVRDEMHWRDATRAVEDRVSDALHERLTQRFVDRRTSVLLRRLKQKEALLAEVNDKGEVTVEGEFVGKLEGFRFRHDKDATGQEAKTLKAASLQALAPHFHLRADRFYNAPDTEIDFTEQGGLMWGTQAVGKLTAGDDALKPRVVAFVDDEAGPDVLQKVQRRLQHFIDRKIAALFEPLLNIQHDETLTGLARGFGFRMVEAMGIIPRAEIADEVKALEQEARSALRKHGIRFGQYTIFMPLLLKPAPTRLRLVLWSLKQGLDEFPEAPPAGLVTVPNIADIPAEHYTIAGYRKSGQRAIRIDMLERLADLLRAEDSRGGFEAKADMLSITGMTLEQFADLMGGMGYKAEKGERTKVKAVDTVIPRDSEANIARPLEETPEEANADTPVFDAGQSGAAGGITHQPEMSDATPEASEAVVEIPDSGNAPIAETAAEAEPDAAVPDVASTEVTVGTAPDADIAGAELETFYTFTWGGMRGNRERGPRREAGGREGGQGNRGRRSDGAQGRGGEGQNDRPRGKGKGKPGGKPGGKRPDREDKGAKTFEARPPRREKPIDPDNPFAAALMGFKDKS
ncbi:helicase-related protein [Puniceibacterium sediminis]|uniref:ATP-dependent RNA helicase SUPV3L1/SUV3 n=1 Tax=Puniceibacterium sediminis TaxID=1608407 RepID=A0A238X9R5_9RHOB|nr:helicase-related protein [Puniceibacterium sediminis]SNR55786.1 ATP-dependent RNA helicase SUPV3L1/SUV3 [Puniceibacterium sediminis]